MPRRSQVGDTERLRAQLVALLSDFEHELTDGDLRSRVRALIPAQHLLRDLGGSLITSRIAGSGKGRILHYFRSYPRTAIAGDELMVVAGIGEWARRVRELRREDGWQIISGITLAEMMTDGAEEDATAAASLPPLAPDQYMLLRDRPDLEAARRWRVANGIRKLRTSVRERILAYFRENVGAEVTGEELRYVAGDKTEWARRTRELRTEFGWPILTMATGRPDLPVGVYVLEEDRQAPEHDRQIPDFVRREVLMRDGYRCTACGWHHELWNRSDPRHLEAHHIIRHVDRGSNAPENLTTLCTACHDKVHASD